MILREIKVWFFKNFFVEIKLKIKLSIKGVFIYFKVIYLLNIYSFLYNVFVFFLSVRLLFKVV